MVKVFDATIVLSVELVDYPTACSSRPRGDLHENFQRHVAIMFNSSISGARIDVRPSSEGHGTCCNFPSGAK